MKSTGILLSSCLCLCSMELMALRSSKAADQYCAPGWPRPYRITASHIEGKGIGYGQGYTSINGFFALDKYDQVVPFLDIRNHISNDGKYAANVGVGARYLVNSMARSFGGNLYYDYRSTKRQHYNQIGFGLEALGTHWDFRANGYFPLGNRTSHYYDTKFYAFSGNNILVQRKKEFGMAGFDAEAGYHLRIHQDWPLYIAAGPYYIHGKFGHNSWGGDARASIGYKDYVSVQGSYSYDSVFHSIWQGQVSLTLPFGGRRKLKKAHDRSHRSCNEAYLTRQTLLQDVYRKEIVVVDRINRKLLAFSPATGDPYNIFFVDNTSHSAGTYESPFSTLADAESASNPNDVIYVFPGDGTTNGMDSGITLQDGQYLFGSGIGNLLPTTVGQIIVPNLTTAMPTITNSSGNVVTIGNNNTISGICMMQSPTVSGTSGIYQPTSGSYMNLNVMNNIIVSGGSPGSGITLNNIGGTINISNNQIVESDYGISISNTGINNSNIIIQNNDLTTDYAYYYTYADCYGNAFTFTNNRVFIGEYVIGGTTNNSVVGAANTWNITNNDITGYYVVDVSSDGASINNLVFTGNTCQTYYGIYDYRYGTSGGTFICSDNTLNITYENVYLEINNNATLTSRVENNIINSYDTESIYFGLYDDTVTTLTIANNQIQGSFGEGIEIEASTSASGNVSILNNSITGVSYGIYVTATDSSSLMGQVQNNSLYTNLTSGLYLDTAGSASGIWNVSKNTFYSNVAAAIVEVDGTSTGCLRFLNNTAFPTTNAFYLTQTGGTFNLEPLMGNTGAVATTGLLTLVPPGTCQP